mmetsp:Transcript_10297/g.32000  ORF Transcript_10297/g.32000 Transcript_10297/m.32000 type:complete len:582 (-) Transcript_10297:342-2087(-)
MDRDQLAGQHSLRRANVGPLGPEHRLTEPSAIAHVLGHVELLQRVDGLHGVPQQAADDVVGGLLLLLHAELEEVVPGREVHDVHGLAAEAVQRLLVHVVAEPQQRVLQEVRPQDLVAQLRAQGRGKHGERRHVPVRKQLLLGHALHDLPLHAPGHPPGHRLLAEEVPQLPQLLGLVLLRHLQLRHGGGERGHQRAHEEQAEDEAENVELALDGIQRSHPFQTSGRQLRDRPVKRGEVVVQGASVLEGHVRRQRVEPALARVRGRVAADGVPRAAEHVVQPQDGEEELQALEHHAGGVRETPVHQGLEEVAQPDEAEQVHDPQEACHAVGLLAGVEVGAVQTHAHHVAQEHEEVRQEPGAQVVPRDDGQAELQLALAVEAGEEAQRQVRGVDGGREPADEAQCAAQGLLPGHQVGQHHHVVQHRKDNDRLQEQSPEGLRVQHQPGGLLLLLLRRAERADGHVAGAHGALAIQRDPVLHDLLHGHHVARRGRAVGELLAALHVRGPGALGAAVQHAAAARARHRGAAVGQDGGGVGKRARGAADEGDGQAAALVPAWVLVYRDHGQRDDRDPRIGRRGSSWRW